MCIRRSAGLDRFLDFQRTNDDEFLPAWERVSELQAVAIDPAADLNSLVDEAIARHEVSFEELVGPGRTRQLTRTRIWLAKRAQASGVASQAEVASLLNRSRQAIFDLLKRH